MKDYASMTPQELECEAWKRIDRYRYGSRPQRAYRVYYRVWLRWFIAPMCNRIYGPRYRKPIGERTWRDNAVMALRVSPLVLGVIAVYALTFAGVLS